MDMTTPPTAVQSVSIAATASQRFRTLRKRDVLYHAGDKAEKLYRVYSGHVALLMEDTEGNRVYCALVGMGETFGEEALYGETRRHRAVPLKKEEATVEFLELSFQNAARVQRDAFLRAKRLQMLYCAPKGEERVRRALEMYPVLIPNSSKRGDHAIEEIAICANMSREGVHRIVTTLKKNGGF